MQNIWKQKEKCTRPETFLHICLYVRFDHWCQTDRALGWVSAQWWDFPSIYKLLRRMTIRMAPGSKSFFILDISQDPCYLWQIKTIPKHRTLPKYHKQKCPKVTQSVKFRSLPKIIQIQSYFNIVRQYLKSKYVSLNLNVESRNCCW